VSKYAREDNNKKIIIAIPYLFCVDRPFTVVGRNSRAIFSRLYDEFI